MKTGDVMSTGAATVRPDASLADAVRLMIEHRISGLPVVDAGGKLVGIVTEHDLIRQRDRQRPPWFDALLSDSSGQDTARELTEGRVRDVMSSPAISVDIETDVKELVETMQKDGIKRVPVLAQGKVVGIVSRANLLEALIRRAERSSR